jgi:4-aminobutyrate aminotransferase-like enzyme
VILLSSGTYGNTVRVLAPLTTPDEVVDEGLVVMEQALEAVV